MSNTPQAKVDFDEILNDMENSTDLFDMVEIPQNLGFTKDQLRFMNIVMVNALRRYHGMLFPES